MSNGNSQNISDYEGWEDVVIMSEVTNEDHNTFHLGEASKCIERNYVEIN